MSNSKKRKIEDFIKRKLLNQGVLNLAVQGWLPCFSSGVTVWSTKIKF
jgi:hypothetical protein